MSFWPNTLVDYAQILSAIATAAAVIVSLWLSLRRPKPTLRVQAGIRSVLWHGMDEDIRPEYVSIFVTNVGAVDATVNSLAWRMGRWPWRRQWAFQMLAGPDAYVPFDKLPVTLTHGQQAAFNLPIYGEQDWLDDVRKGELFPNAFQKRSDLRHLRLTVNTSVGKTFVCEPERPLLDRIFDASRRQNVA